MILQRIIILLILIIFSCQNLRIEAQTVEPKSDVTQAVFPEKIGFVNDFENLFTEEEVTFLENALDYYKRNSNREIVVITIDTLPNHYQFDHYALLISKNWNVGEA
ncbi:MAG: TPM domain-containing protein, partial [Salinimicrobium sediminis]|nr:TPM domain-containing protein [Salinimicrobium sediminis]